MPLLWFSFYHSDQVDGFQSVLTCFRSAGSDRAYVSSLGNWVASPVIPQMLDVLARLPWISSRLCCDSGLGFTLKKIKSHRDVAQFSSFILFLLFNPSIHASIWPGTCFLPVKTFTYFPSVSVSHISGGWAVCLGCPCCVATTGWGRVIGFGRGPGEDGKSQVCAANTPLHVCVSIKLGHFTCVSHKGPKSHSQNCNVFFKLQAYTRFLFSHIGTFDCLWMLQNVQKWTGGI